MQETIAQILSYVWGIWRFRWMALVIVWLVALGGWLFVEQIPEKYVGSARLYVDTNNVLGPLLQGLTIQPNISQRVSMMSRTLLSRPNLEKVMRMTDLDLEVQTDLQKESLLSGLRDSISLRAERGNVYTIKVVHKSRETAKRITQALITVFIEGGLSGKRDDSSGAQDFLNQQIAEYEGRLAEAESRLATFKQRYAGSLPGSQGSYYSRLQQAKQVLEAAQLELREAENRRSELQRQVDGEEPILLFGGGSPFDARIQALQAQADMLLAKYTDLHPEVRQIRALIADLEVEKEAMLELGSSVDNSGAYAELSASPVYQGIRAMLAESEANVAQLRVRVAEYEDRVTALDEQVNNVPLIEAELKQLDRDYQIIAGKHNQLLSRRESMRLGEDVEQTAGDVTFRVIDPPFVPSKPSEPDKLILNSMVLIMALGAGAAVALLMSFIKPVVVDQQSLVRLTGLPLLGTITMVPTPEEKKRENWGLVAFSSLMAVLVFAFVGLNIGQALMLARV